MAWLLVVGCSGQIGFTEALPRDEAPNSPTADANSPTLPTAPVPITPDESCDAQDAAPEPLRRLTPLEYAYTVEDILGVQSDAAKRLVAEPGQTGFDTDASSYTTSQLHVERFLEVAQTVAQEVPLSVLTADCDLSSDARGCVRRVLSKQGRRLIRRSFTEDEFAEYETFYDGLVDDYSAEAKLRLVLQAVLMSPDFLYRPEFDNKTEVELRADWEVASRLSYAIWGSAPDEALLAKAEAGALRDPQVLAEEATRMLSDGKARRRMADFYRQLLELDALATMEKDSSLAPTFTSLRGDMRTEVDRMMDYAMWEGSGTLRELLTADYTFTSEQLATAVGLPSPSADWERVSLAGSARSGLLTTAGFMAIKGNIARSSPVKRGQFVREILLCQSVPPPPDDVDITIPELDPTMTNREQFAELTKNETCANCHSFMNPIGFAFETFDAAGQYRATQNGKVIDATGELAMTDVDGAFSNAKELTTMLAGSSMLEACFVQRWFRYTAGRVEGVSDACVVQQLQKTFADEGGLVPALLARVATTHAFAAAEGGN